MINLFFDWQEIKELGRLGVYGVVIVALLAFACLYFGTKERWRIAIALWLMMWVGILGLISTYLYFDFAQIFANIAFQKTLQTGPFIPAAFAESSIYLVRSLALLAAVGSFFTGCLGLIGIWRRQWFAAMGVLLGFLGYLVCLLLRWQFAKLLVVLAGGK